MADTTTMRVSTGLRDRVNTISATMHKPAGDVLELAVRSLEKELFWEAYADAHARVTADPAVRAERDADLAVWDRAGKDGLAPEDWSDIAS